MTYLRPDEADRLLVIAPNFKQRLSGVTSTIIQLVPMLKSMGLTIATFGPGLPPSLPKLRYRDLWRLWKRPAGAGKRVWHARRNTEMVGGLVLGKILRMPLRLVFTSASQRHHHSFTKWLIRQMDFVIATSAKTASYLEVDNRVILHGIDTVRFAPPVSREDAKREVGLDPSLRYVGCFGRVRHQKGTDLFLDAVIPVLRDNPEWAAVIAGRATAEHAGYENELRERAKGSGLGDRVLFVGEHRNIDAWYKALDLFVAPQRWEGFGLTPLEAMSSGVPVVATDVGAFSEIVVDGVTGTLLQDLVPETMTAAIRAFAEHDALRAKAGEAARRHAAENFPLEREAGDLLAVYREQLAKAMV